MRPGDLILSGHMSSSLSWAVMYMSNFPLSHLAIYVGDKRIAHATTAGVCEHDIKVLFGANNILLPLLPPLETSKRAEVQKLTQSFAGIPYGWRDVRQKAIWRISGRDWPRFHWRLGFDISMLLFMLGAIIASLIRTSTAYSVVPVVLYTAIIAVNCVRWHMAPIPLMRCGGPADFFVLLGDLDGE